MNNSYLIQIKGNKLTEELIDKIKEISEREPELEVDIVFYNESQKYQLNGQYKYKVHHKKLKDTEQFLNELIRNNSTDTKE